jgi:hypothetical protein
LVSVIFSSVTVDLGVTLMLIVNTEDEDKTSTCEKVKVKTKPREKTLNKEAGWLFFGMGFSEYS